MELQNIARVGALIGAGLSTEEISGLESSMLLRKLQENLTGKMFFWGKVNGSTQDYLVVYNVDPFGEFPDKKYYFCTTSNYVLRNFPQQKAGYEDQASKIITAFTGDPSFFAYNGEEPEPEDPEAPPVERFREMNRLAYTVKTIDNNCAVVPRGALVVDATKKAIPNLYFNGLSHQSSTELRSYMHLRRPETLQGQSLLNKAGIIKSGDFLDCIDRDAPNGIWTIAHNPSATIAHVRNLFWEGFAFYHVLNSNEYGNVYFGNGVANLDIAFML